MSAHRVVTVAGVILLVVMLCIPVLVNLGVADSTRHMEVLTILSAQETWMRMESGGQDAWLVPTWNGRARVNKPPLAVWIPVWLWSHLPETRVDSVSERIGVARMASFLAALCAAIGAGWFASVKGGRQQGVLAAIICLTMIGFIRQARLASYDTWLMGFSALAVAAGWQAFHSENRKGRMVALLLASALSLALAVLSKGPVSYIFIAFPLFLLSLLVVRKVWAVGGTAAICIVGTLLAIPWYLFVLRLMPEASQIMFHEYQADRDNAQPFWYYAGVIGLVFPWSIWLIAGLVVPWMGRHQERSRRWGGWLWFVGVFVAMSCAEAKQQRYIVPLLPAAAVIVSEGWVWICDQFRLQEKQTKLCIWSRIHWGLLLLLSFAAGLFFALQSVLVAHGYLDEPEIAHVSGWFALPLFALSALLISFGRKRHMRGHCVSAVVATALWMLVWAAPGMYGYTLSLHGMYEQKEVAEEIADLTTGFPFFYYYPPEGRRYLDEPDQKFSLYSTRPTPRLTRDELLQQQGEYFLIVRDNENVLNSLQTIPLQKIRHFHDGGRARWLLKISR